MSRVFVLKSLKHFISSHIYLTYLGGPLLTNFVLLKGTAIIAIIFSTIEYVWTVLPIRSMVTKGISRRWYVRKMKHGQSCKGKETPEYLAWRHMKARCLNPHHKSYKNYGSRGIQVCKRWLDFRNFYEDMGTRPGSDYSLDRSNNDGNYEPDNCKWSTRHEQQTNKRPFLSGPYKQRFFYAHGPHGEMIIWNNQNEVARLLSLDQSHISGCLRGTLNHHKGWHFQWI